jgi:hypothetical protein
MAGAGIFLFVGESQLFLGTHDLLPNGPWNFFSEGNNYESLSISLHH